jgi:hypothetical protein
MINMSVRYEGWEVEEVYEEVGDSIVDMFYDGQADDLPQNYEGEIVSLLDNDGLDVGFDTVYNGKEIYLENEAGKSVLGKTDNLFGKIEPLSRLGYTRAEVDNSDTELIEKYESRLTGGMAALGGLASLSLIAGPTESSIFYEFFNEGMPRKVLAGIGITVGSALLAAQRYDSGRGKKYEEEITSRRAEELVDRFGEYTVTIKDEN